ncbi:hypothetical protein JK621_14520 [Serratia plymuthica]|uniref:hypothetical protein n=1 Tax=Serratia plymuthica TaxID=82996 RepID=UPI001BB08E3F|nr:hypothetical protein [Serratia plymuthica]QUY46670.1 hypothetical protein JK621_14520 [Serratia plymuthica]
MFFCHASHAAVAAVTVITAGCAIVCVVPSGVANGRAIPFVTPVGAGVRAFVMFMLRARRCSGTVSTVPAIAAAGGTVSTVPAIAAAGGTVAPFTSVLTA